MQVLARRGGQAAAASSTTLYGRLTLSTSSVAAHSFVKVSLFPIMSTASHNSQPNEVSRINEAAPKEQGFLNGDHLQINGASACKVTPRRSEALCFLRFLRVLQIARLWRHSTLNNSFFRDTLLNEP